METDNFPMYIETAATHDHDGRNVSMTGDEGASVTEPELKRRSTVYVCTECNARVTFGVDFRARD